MTDQEGQASAQYNSLRALLAAPKGNLEYQPGDAFLLQVFWQTPSIAAARKLLSGLRGCAVATHRDTPCVPTYFFRIANNQADLCPPPPRTVGDHPHLREAHKKLQLGVPLPAVRAGLAKLGLDPDLLDLDPAAALPAALQAQPVAVECTEVYLDERAFMEHAGSRDYLDSYGVVMGPELQHERPCTLRLGTPPAHMIERILEPILRENVAPVVEGCAVWRRPPAGTTSSGPAVMLSLDVEEAQPAAVAAALPAAFREHCTTCVAFVHPLREGTTRLLCVLPFLPPRDVLAALASLRLARGEAHMTVPDDAAAAVRAALTEAGLAAVTLNASECVGYVLHAQAADIHPHQSI